MSIKKTARDTQDEENLTAVYIRYRKNRINHRLRFGEPQSETWLGWHSRLASFKPAKIFSYIRWSANEYGTQDWRLFVCKAGGSHSQNLELDGGNTGHHNCLTRIPGVLPGAHILLKTQGKARVKRALVYINAIEKETGELSLVTESYWRHLHNRLEVNHPPHDFSSLQARLSIDAVVGESIQTIDMAIR